MIKGVINSRKFSHLLRQAVRCDNGQGNKLHFRGGENVNFHYATFWNDFTHYSLYDAHPSLPALESSIKFDEIEQASNSMFVDKEDWLTGSPVLENGMSVTAVKDDSRPRLIENITV
jgi:hypothetical protein